MPVIFIHGVNTRDTDPNYQKDVVVRNDLLQRRIFDVLAEKGDRFKKIEIVNVYWGNHGVHFRWNMKSLPNVSVFEHMGAEEEDLLSSDIAFTETTKALAGPHTGASPLELLGEDQGLLKRAAEKDLTRFMEAVLTPLLLSKMSLTDNANAQPKQEGILQALLATAVVDVARDPNMQVKVSAVATNEELLDLLEQQVKERFEQLVRDRQLEPQATATSEPHLEKLGSSLFDEIQDRVGELFERAKDAPGRVAAVPALQFFREGLHGSLSRFTGDIFVYINERGEKATPGPIIKTVLDGITNAPRNDPNEPLIIITHSMGGNILYDILTHYAPGLKIDFWASVAGQVGLFEEMKLFRASDTSVIDPAQVKGLRSQVRYWLNVFDPADVLSFKAAPIFEDVNADLPYLTGSSTLKAHGEYFGRASFYDLLREHIEKALL